MSNNLSSGSFHLVPSRSLNRHTSIDSEGLLRKGAHVVGDGRSHNGLVVNRITLDSAGSEGVTDLVRHARDEASNQISILVSLSRSSSQVSRHLGEDIVDQQHFSGAR